MYMHLGRGKKGNTQKNRPEAYPFFETASS
jgi:hypothetical protein